MCLLSNTYGWIMMTIQEIVQQAFTTGCLTATAEQIMRWEIKNFAFKFDSKETFSPATLLKLFLIPHSPFPRNYFFSKPYINDHRNHRLIHLFLPEQNINFYEAGCIRSY